ncbi:MAG: PDZ domain-containing protein, partial [Clostridiales bacterium]|nr:PDZ domain-containing protein [Clostridiales bacterium]
MKKQFCLKTVIALMLCASALTCVLVLAFVGLRLGLGTDMFGEIRTYIALRREIGDEYIGTYDGKKVSEAALSAAVAALDDEWSYYLTPEQYRDYINSSNNRYSGLGISVRTDDVSGGILIISVYAGSPAEKSGITAGEIITAIDGSDITGMPLTDATALIDRQIGQSVILTLEGTDGAVRDVSVEYGLIETNPVHYELLKGAVGYI